MTRSVTARAPGKVNIQLAVGRVRDDGFHPLASVFPAVGLSEEVTVAEGEPGGGICIDDVTGPQAHEVPRDRTVVIYCRSGQRSETAARTLMKAGYTAVYNLRGGVLAWARDVDPGLLVV